MSEYKNKHNNITKKTLAITLAGLFSISCFTLIKFKIGNLEVFGKEDNNQNEQQLNIENTNIVNYANPEGDAKRSNEEGCNEGDEFILEKGDNNSHCGGRVVIILKELNDEIADIDFNMIPSFNQVKTGNALPFELNGKNYELKITQVDSTKELMRYRIIPKS